MVLMLRKLLRKWWTTCPTQGDDILGARRQVHVQEKHKKMREMKDPRMKNLANSVFIKRVLAILTSSIPIYFMFKNSFSFFRDLIPWRLSRRDWCFIYYSSTSQDALHGSYQRTWRKSIQKDSKDERVDYYLEDIQEALVGPPFKIYVRTTS
jgi:hypothetical protein